MIKHQQETKSSWILLLFVFVVALALAWSGFWLFGANLVKTKANEQIFSLQNQGYEIGFEGFKVRGWPYRFVVTVSGVQFTTPPDNGSVQFNTSVLRVHAMAWKLSHLIVELPKSVQILTAGGQKLTYNSERTRASLVFDDNGLSRASLELLQPSFQSSAVTLFQAELSEVHFRPGGDADSRNLFVFARSPVWPNMPINPLDEIRLNGEVFSWSSLVGGQGLQAFRTPDGMVNIEQALIVSGRARADLSGSLQIDKNGYLTGPVQVKFVYPADILSSLDSNQVAGEVRNTILALSLLIGGVSEAELSFKLRKGGIYTGPFRIGSTAQVLP